MDRLAQLEKLALLIIVSMEASHFKLGLFVELIIEIEVSEDIVSVIAVL